MAAAASGGSCPAGNSNRAGMEVDAAAVPAVMASGVTGSVSVKLHPLVILNISDHWIRMRLQERRPVQVIGTLIGRQEGRNIELMNSFELLSHTVEENVVIDKEYYYTKEEHLKQVFKELGFLGWYTTGGPPDQSDIHVHKQVCEIIESPLFLKLNPMTKHTDLPVSVFESVIDIINREVTMLYAELTYTLATEEAEGIGVDHVARMTATGSVTEHLINIRT
ncbi:COP9 signalosome complex subunit 6-like isoform X2 [Rhineura floridana]|uniref:COP9 signalosome complex subunit 6-like isoform X2 n=1 Tax=Rhineura floridana TaxID=261503 RepID=UPI002AC7E7F7|nr:COP9 signalosome complex subunit 6-like isoform X2 [Rhineura floridana]